MSKFKSIMIVNIVQEYPASSEEELEADGDADLLAKNEIAAHTALQQQLLGLAAVPGSEHIVRLLGTASRPLGRQVIRLGGGTWKIHSFP